MIVDQAGDPETMRLTAVSSRPRTRSAVRVAVEAVGVNPGRQHGADPS
jgi:NADPH:quinone reductase-like Zn-dependent oxidoreductase